MDFEERIEIDAEREQQRRKRHPRESRVAKFQEEEWQRYVERRDEKETVEAHSIFEPLQIGLHGLRSAGAKRVLHLVLKLLLASELLMRLRIALPGEGGGNAV